MGDAPEILLQVRWINERILGDGGQARTLEVRASLHLEESRPHKQLESDQGRDGVAGQSDQGYAADCAKQQRLAWPQGHLPEINGLPLFEQPADEVVGTHRYAAGADNEVRVTDVSESDQQFLALVARDAGIDADGPGIFDGREQRVPIGIRDLARPE